MLLEKVLAQWWHPVASSEALDLLQWAMRTVLYRRIVMAIETASKVGVLFDCCLFAVALADAGANGASSCPMPASSGFQSSRGHAALGDAVCIAPAHLRGRQNGRRRRCICLSLLIFSSTIAVAK
jgi:hypothetical protein